MRVDLEGSDPSPPGNKFYFSTLSLSLSQLFSNVNWLGQKITWLNKLLIANQLSIRTMASSHFKSNCSDNIHNVILSLCKLWHCFKQSTLGPYQFCKKGKVFYNAFRKRWIKLFSVMLNLWSFEIHVFECIKK